MKAVPARYRGVWVRTLLQTPCERDTTTFVRWLQTGLWHADLRVPEASRMHGPPDLARQQGFCGVTQIDPAPGGGADVCTWHRHHDYHPPRGTPDAGHMVFDGPDRLLETGVHGHYLEVWQRLPGSQGRSIALAGLDEHGRDNGARVLVAGQYMMHVRPRAVNWPPVLEAEDDLAAVIARHASRVDEWLDMEISFGELVADRWTVEHSTLPALERRSHPCLLQRLDADTAQIHGARLAGHWRVLEWCDQGE